MVEAFPTIDGAAPGIHTIVDRVDAALDSTPGTLTGVAAVDQDFLHALFGSFPYVLAIVLLLTFVLLTRAFRSVMLAIKAVLLNLMSLAAAFGIVVLVFQQGHGSQLWDVGATGAITAYVPLMIFAFLYGLSIDYEVFMLSRMREAYDETGSADRAIELGLARTGKLVTSGALILMFAFLTLSTTPGFEIKSLAVGVAARNHLRRNRHPRVPRPALMRLMGAANWWMPNWTRAALRIPAPQRPPHASHPYPLRSDQQAWLQGAVCTLGSQARPRPNSSNSIWCARWRIPASCICATRCASNLRSGWRGDARAGRGGSGLSRRRLLAVGRRPMTHSSSLTGAQVLQPITR